MKQKEIVWLKDPIKDSLMPTQKICLKKICSDLCFIRIRCTCHNTALRS